VPTFNRANLIEATIASLLKQTYAAIEIIVVDDHSTDNTAAVIDGLTKLDKRIQYHHRPNSKPKGANACRNFGLELATGTFVKWIDSDDLLSADAIQLQLDAINKEHTDLCICKTSIFTDENKLSFIKNWGDLNKPATPIGFIVEGFRFHTCAGLWRKSFFDNVTPWDEAQMNSQEWLMHFQQLCKNITIVKCNEYLSFARYHASNMSNRKNKRGAYYYNECTARIKAIAFAQKQKIPSPALYKKLTKELYWYFLFVIYKGAPAKALSLMPSLFKNVRYLFTNTNPSA
jgi:glycosyltransferase involved in cell wall biosynthesis